MVEWWRTSSHVRFWCCEAVPFFSLMVTLMMAENSSDTLGGLAKARETKTAATTQKRVATLILMVHKACRSCLCRVVCFAVLGPLAQKPPIM
jgi:hypothetical protein